MVPSPRARYHTRMDKPCYISITIISLLKVEICKNVPYKTPN